MDDIAESRTPAEVEDVKERGRAALTAVGPMPENPEDRVDRVTDTIVNVLTAASDEGIDWRMAIRDAERHAIAELD